MRLEDIKLKDKEGKIKRKIEEPFFKPIIVYKDDMDKFEQKAIKITVAYSCLQFTVAVYSL